MRREDLLRVAAIHRQLARAIAPAEWLSLAERAIDDGDPPLSWVAELQSGAGSADPWAGGRGPVETLSIGRGAPSREIVAAPKRVIGYAVGRVRAWEFGSAPAGWVIAIGVDVEHQRERAGRDLLTALVESFRARGASTIRTMVRRDDVAVLRFFRSAGFAVGPYTELEMEVPRDRR
jgi:ribosomal protein S18 acetylase RimI-like enzyme